jgi:integrase
MAARRKNKRSLWSHSLGHRGTRIRIFEKRTGGMLYRAAWVREPGEVRGRREIASLGTYDRAEATRMGEALLAEMLRGSRASQGPVLLGDLCARFQRENGEQVNNKPRSRADDAMRARVLVAFFGSVIDVRTVTALHCHQFSQARRRGGIRLANGVVTGPIGQRSVEADLGLLHRMLAWACTVPVGLAGNRWLERNPLDGIRRERERNPRRPVATWERFAATRQAIQRLTAQARESASSAMCAMAVAEVSEVKKLRWEIKSNELAVARWQKIELALVVAEATGRRLGAVAALRWEDIDFQRNRITWRAESDKKGVQWVVPMPAPFVEELRGFQKKLGSTGGLLFPSEGDPGHSMNRKQFDKWLREAEDAAGLPALDGGLWHPYRRKWASERMHLPLKAVSNAGGWKNTTTLLTCYQHPDDTLLAQVMSEPRKVREAGAVSA